MDDTRDTRRDPADESLQRAIAALRQPMSVSEAARARLLRALQAEAPPVREPATRSRATEPALATVRARMGTRRVTASSTAGALATAAGVAMLLVLGADRHARLAPAGVAVRAPLADTVAATLRDTMRLVRFVLHAPSASRVALAGDFNAWDPRATPLRRDSAGGAWHVALALAPGMHRYAFVVNDTQWVRDPSAPAAEVDELAPPRSVLTVPASRP